MIETIDFKYMHVGHACKEIAINIFDTDSGILQRIDLTVVIIII
jgi:hypothetical protein